MNAEIQTQAAPTPKGDQIINAASSVLRRPSTKRSSVKLGTVSSRNIPQVINAQNSAISKKPNRLSERSTNNFCAVFISSSLNRGEDSISELPTMTTAIDLFAGLGGWSTGARAAGIEVRWAANHWPEAVKWHAANHPTTDHVCQDLHQARWERVPGHDILLASPCCQGHSKARGKASGNPQHDSSRSTAWAVVSALEFHRPEGAVVENVPEFVEWSLYPAWLHAVQALGYQVAPHIVDCADLGVPQHRVRLFLVLTRSRAPLMLELHKRQHVPAASFLDFSAGKWTPIEKPGRAAATLTRVANGRARFGDQFIMPYYGKGSGLTGRDIARPIGTITTLDRWALVRGDEMRMLSANEALAAQSFPADTLRPDSHRLTMHMAGNAVPPKAAQIILEAMMAAA